MQELNRYRSDFFGRLRQILGARADIRVVGDRFVFESSVLFDVGKADISPAGEGVARHIGQPPSSISSAKFRPTSPGSFGSTAIPTASRSGGGPFKSNWELSAARAVAVVQYLVSKGVEPDRLAAAGFGEFQPIDQASGDAAMARNRRSN